MLSILLTTAVAFFSYMIGQKSGWNAYRVIGESRRVTAETYKDMLDEVLESRNVSDEGWREIVAMQDEQYKTLKGFYDTALSIIQAYKAIIQSLHN
jgi:hypothetical protein